MEYLIITLLCIDILVGLFASFRAESKPNPLTFLELFNFIYDQKEELIKILRQESKEISRQMFENLLKIKDEIRRKNEK